MLAELRHLPLLSVMGLGALLPILWLYLPTAFIRHNNGVKVSFVTSVAAFLAYFVFALICFYKQHDLIRFVFFLVFCGFCFMFFVLDASNNWLPFEFTLPFLILGLLVHVNDGCEGISMLASLFMFIFLLSLRTIMSKCYRSEPLGKGDVWLVSGIAAWSGFIYAASVMALGIFIVLILAAIKMLYMKYRSLPLRNNDMSLPLAPGICLVLVLSTVFNIPLISELSFLRFI